MENQLATFLGYSPLILIGSAIAAFILFKANQLKPVGSDTQSGSSDHPTPKLYVQIAAVLLAITVLEVVIVIVEMPTMVLIPSLLILSTIKFGFVIGYYMHLKFDHKLFSTMFLGGLFLAIGVMVALIGLFGNFTLPGDVVVAESKSDKHHELHVDSPLRTLLGLNGSKDGVDEGSASGQEKTVLEVISGGSGAEFAFEPGTITGNHGETVEIRFDNQGTIAHDFAIPDLGFSVSTTNANEIGTAVLTLPQTAGTYEFICSIPGHKEAGMTGQLIVN